MVLAFDLGGTRLKAALVDPDGRVGNVEVVELPVRASVRDAFDAMAKAAASIGGEHPDGVAVAVPGIVADGVVVSLPGKLDGLEGTDVAVAVREMFGAERTGVANDAVACAVGEAACGAARGARRTVAVTVGTGVGVCVVEDGRPVGAGPHGGGILGGFIPIAPPGGPVDSTGRTGTIEALCRAERIVELARDAGGTYGTVPEVFDACAGGDPAACAGLDAYREVLARALVALAHAHAPDVIVVGGGPLSDASPVLRGVEAAVNERLWPGYGVRVVPAALGDAAALIGVAQLLS